MDEVDQLNRISVYKASDKYFPLHIVDSLTRGFNFCESLACKLRKRRRELVWNARQPGTSF